MHCDEAVRDLEDFRNDELVDAHGLSFREFRKSLQPRFSVVWRDILTGHCALGAIAAAAVASDVCVPHMMPLTIAMCAIAFGLVHAYIHNFFHEAAHFNIAGSRAANDLLANIFIGSLAGQDIKRYRVIHMAHHRHLGTPMDTERTYFNALTLRFVVTSLTGLRVIQVLAGRHAMRETAAVRPVERPDGGTPKLQLLAGLMINGGIVLAAAWFGHWSLAIAWMLGIGAFFPFFSAVRQLLEHRDYDARSDVDYSAVPHGTCNRMFGGGPLARILGSAGFNRHMLHHWEPQISYTRLGDVERFLMNTAAAPAVRQHRTSYLRTFARLFHL